MVFALSVLLLSNRGNETKPTPVVQMAESGQPPARTSKPPQTTSKTLMPGDDAVVDAGNLVVHVAISKAALDRSIKAAIARDDLGHVALLLDEEIFVIEVGTLVRVIDIGFMTSEIRILEGKHAGRSGFLPSEFVVPLTRRAELQERMAKHRRSIEEDLKLLDKLDDAEWNEKDANAKRVAEEKMAKSNAEAKAKQEQDAAKRKAVIRANEVKDAEYKRLEKEAEEIKAAEILKWAKYWMNEEKDEARARDRIAELRRRFPDSNAAKESLKIFPIKP